MKSLFALCLIYTISLVQCGIISSPALVRTPNLDTSIVRSERIGDSFAYSTLEGHAYAPVAPVLQTITQPIAISYAATPLAFPQPIYTQSILNQLLSNPIYAGLITQTPVAGQFPIIGQNPVVGQPAQPPVQSPIQSPVVQPPQAAPQGDAPLQGTVVDEDTVAVESAV